MFFEEFIDYAQGVMSCPECKHRMLHVKISADDVSFVDSMVLDFLTIVDFNILIF